MGNVHQARCKKKKIGIVPLNRKKFTSNIACRAELGRLLLLIPINQKIMKYFVYLNNKDNDCIVKQAFLMSKNHSTF